MDQPILRPTCTITNGSDSDAPRGADGERAATSPKQPRRYRPGWKATLVRIETLHLLRELQKSTSDPVLDLSYLTDACVRLALELGCEAIVSRAVADLRPTRSIP